VHGTLTLNNENNKATTVTRKKGTCNYANSTYIKRKVYTKSVLERYFKIGLILSQESKSVRCQKLKGFFLVTFQECIIGMDTV
jgi:hypothetical protein